MAASLPVRITSSWIQHEARWVLPLDWIVVLYFLSYLPNILLTKLATSRVHPQLGRPLTGLETLPIDDSSLTCSSRCCSSGSLAGIVTHMGCR